MPDTPRSQAVSVVVPTRDRGDLLATTLASVLGQREVEVDVVVVDDGSRAPAQVAAAGNGVRVIRHEQPRGVAAARNTGLAAARHGFVAFTDDDDPWAPDKLRSQLDALAKNPGAGWSCTGSVTVDGELRIIGYQRPPAPGDVADLLLHKNVVPAGGSAVLARTDLVRDVGGFDERLRNLADYDLWVRLGIAAPLASVDRPLVAWRIHRGAMSLDLTGIAQERAVVRDKYAATRRARGVEVGRQVDLWIGDRHERAGNRWRATRSYLRATASMPWTRVLPRVVTVPLPGAVRLRDRLRGIRRPPEWREEDLTWLADLRARDGNRATAVE